MKNIDDDQLVRVDRKLLARVKAVAKREGRTMKGEVERMLHAGLQMAAGEKRLTV